MPTCPKCHQKVSDQATACPYCRVELKAFGHPGMPLHRANKDEYLCDTCLYHADDTCNFPQRPYAIECTLYRDRTPPPEPPKQPSDWGRSLRIWCQRHQRLLTLAVLIAISIIAAIAAQK
ncbi:MAG: zinc ribbon domain-containing protein [Cyanosarcina radialis HA8281-LM2]|nr:zinc ribbon domain-containing protein [Cyanosarcina radialis HA8281-LM2]